MIYALVLIILFFVGYFIGALAAFLGLAQADQDFVTIYLLVKKMVEKMEKKNGSDK